MVRCYFSVGSTYNDTLNFLNDLTNLHKSCSSHVVMLIFTTRSSCVIDDSDDLRLKF